MQLLSDSLAIESGDDISDGADNYLVASIDIESLFDNSFTETDDVMAFTDRAKLEQTELWENEPKTNNYDAYFRQSFWDSFIFFFIHLGSDILYKDDDGRISLAYERLPGIPKKVADKFASKTHTLDLSYNNIK